jgi:hypothetical protein
MGTANGTEYVRAVPAFSRIQGIRSQLPVEDNSSKQDG